MDVFHYLDQTPLRPLMADPEVSEIMVNGADRIFVERRGMKWATDLRFKDPLQLNWIVERLLEQAPGRRLDASVPFVDVSLPDGTRVNLIIPPVAQSGVHLTIRKYLRHITTLEDARDHGTVDDRMVTFLKAVVDSRLNVLFSGAAGSGKTTLLETMARLMDPRDRIVVMEDTMELHLEQPNTVRLLTRPPNLEGKGEISFDMLFRNCLRMRPDRIILGEIRGAEAVSYLQAINSGHGGSMAVIHASNPTEALLRLENLAASTGLPIPRGVAREQIAQGIDLVVQITQFPDGVRRVTRLTEVVHHEGFDEPQLRHLFGYQAEGRLPDGRIQGRYVATGNRPTYEDRFLLAGVSLPDGLFAADR